MAVSSAYSHRNKQKLAALCAHTHIFVPLWLLLATPVIEARFQDTASTTSDRCRTVATSRSSPNKAADAEGEGSELWRVQQDKSRVEDDVFFLQEGG
ncbi:hypothetical protein H633G_11441 [Metarhizium anisopliae BRIP 53284]|nr:hypothetical protein H633G_11441 [Metarhizium anisopliae BRIP 53284]